MRDDIIDEAVERALFRNPSLRRLSRRICILQDELKARVSSEVWQLYLEIEGIGAERLSRSVRMAARVGERAGRGK
jgi:hypothetical protein